MDMDMAWDACEPISIRPHILIFLRTSPQLHPSIYHSHHPHNSLILSFLAQNLPFSQILPTIRPSLSHDWLHGRTPDRLPFLLRISGAVTLRDPIWYVSSRSSEAVCKLLYTSYIYLTFYFPVSFSCISLHFVVPCGRLSCQVSSARYSLSITSHHPRPIMWECDRPGEECGLVEGRKVKAGRRVLDPVLKEIECLARVGVDDVVDDESRLIAFSPRRVRSCL